MAPKQALAEQLFGSPAATASCVSKALPPLPLPPACSSGLPAILSRLPGASVPLIVRLRELAPSSFDSRASTRSLSSLSDVCAQAQAGQCKRMGLNSGQIVLCHLLFQIVLCHMLF